MYKKTKNYLILIRFTQTTVSLQKNLQIMKKIGLIILGGALIMSSTSCVTKKYSSLQKTDG